MDCSLLGSSLHGIFQAIVLEWVAISFSRGSSWPRDRIRVSCIVDRRFTIRATSCFRIMAIVNNAAMNFGVPAPFSIRVFIFFRYIAKSWVAGSYGSSIFRLLMDLHTVFHSGCTDFYSHQWWMRVPFSPNPCQLLLFMVFLMIVILIDVRWYLIVVLICVFLIISNVEHLFMSVGHLCIFSEKMSIEFFCPVLIRLLSFYIELYEHLYILDINPLFVISFVNIFSHLIACIFILSWFYLLWKKPFKLN